MIRFIGFTIPLGMRNFILTGLLTVSYVAIAIASPQDTAKTTAVPVSKAKIFIANSSWDWGYTPKGIKLSHIYQIKNMGEDTLRIANVAPS